VSDQNNSVKSIGLLGAIAILVGFVMSASMFVLPGGLAALAGPGVFLAFLIAAVPAVFSCIVAAQVAGFFPVDGASYVAISRMVSPRAGFLCMWFLITGAAIGMALLGVGAGNYLQTLAPELDVKFTAVVLIVVLCAMNLYSTRVAVSTQELMVILFVAAIGLFCFTGIFRVDPDNLDPLLPNGFQGVLAAAVPAFFAYVGFMVIVDIGGEVREPSRNIPLALGISFIIVLGLYTVFSIALVGVLPWNELAQMSAPVSIAAARILPSWAVTFITLSTVLAAASTINGILMAYSRDVQAMALQGMLPRVLAITTFTERKKLSRKTQQEVLPRGAITFMGLLAVLMVILGGGITVYATFVVIGALLVQAFLALSVWRVPTREPERYKAAEFKLSKRGLYISSGALMVVSLIFLLLASYQNISVALLAGAHCLLGLAYYSLRRSKHVPSPFAGEELQK
jgi:APA family basic amino acid/polyamine antiporter